jgi:hypothetical protein
VAADPRLFAVEDPDVAVAARGGLQPARRARADVRLRQPARADLLAAPHRQRHALAQVICTFKQGGIADRGQEAQQFRASGLNLVIAAVVY